MVKLHTAELIATMRTIVYKGLLLTSAKDVGIASEKEIVARFMNSPTGLAYRSWIYANNREGDPGKDWLILFQRLTHIQACNDPAEAGPLASDIERTFDALTISDLKSVVSFGSNLVSVVSNAPVVRLHDPVLRAFDQLIEENKAGTLKKLKFLQQQGVNDPEVDLLVALHEHDEKVAREAVEAGATGKVFDGTLLGKYSSKLQGFE